MRDVSGSDCGANGCEREVGHIGGHAPYYGLCDVGGCGNSATGPEVAIYVAVADQYVEVSLCGDHPELATLLRSEMRPGEYEFDSSAFTFVDVPVINGVATLPDGVTVRSSSQVVRVAVVA